MYEGVDHGWKEGRPTGHPFHANPPQREHGRMVVDMEKGQLVFLLAQYEEERVAELQQLREIVPPYCVHHLPCTYKHWLSLLVS